MRYFEKAALLGLPQAARYVRHIKQKLGITPVDGPDLTQLQYAVNAFGRAGSRDEMRDVAERFPIVIESKFIAAFEEIFLQRARQDLKPLLEQRLAWLRQIADEEKREERDQ